MKDVAVRHGRDQWGTVSGKQNLIRASRISSAASPGFVKRDRGVAAALQG
jgi:hypothetical protein